MFDLLVYLFEYHQAVADSHNAVNSQSMSDELEEAGFTLDEINGAFGWLESLVEQDNQNEFKAERKGNRVFSIQEKAVLSLEVRTFLLNLRETDVLDSYSFELVVDRLLALNMREIDIEHVRWVLLMVLCNQPGYEELVDWVDSKMTGSHYYFH